MRLAISRICGLLNRQISIYGKLVEEMLEERKALLVRDLQRLHQSLERQQELVEEIRDIMKDYEEEVDSLYQNLGIPRQASTKTEKLLRERMGREANTLIALSDRLKKVIQRAKRVNRENQRIVEVSSAFFKSYFRYLTDIRAQAFGYTRRGVSNYTAGRNVMINHQI